MTFLITISFGFSFILYFLWILNDPYYNLAWLSFLVFCPFTVHSSIFTSSSFLLYIQTVGCCWSKLWGFVMVGLSTLTHRHTHIPINPTDRKTFFLGNKNSEMINDCLPVHIFFLLSREGSFFFLSRLSNINISFHRDVFFFFFSFIVFI